MLSPASEDAFSISSNIFCSVSVFSYFFEMTASSIIFGKQEIDVFCSPRLTYYMTDTREKLKSFISSISHWKSLERTG